MWGLLGRWYGIQGELEARKEAVLKQVWGLDWQLLIGSINPQQGKLCDTRPPQSRGLLTNQIIMHAPQVRGLTTTSFKSDEPKFEAMALASLDLCRTYVALYRQASGSESPAAAPAVGSTGGARDLAAARMHLRGVIKQCETSFGGHRLLRDMKALLEEIVCMEEAYLAARANTA